jgi:hypothetical protein
LKSFETWRTWLVVVGLIIFGAVASVAWPAIVDTLNPGLNLGVGSGGGVGITAIEPIPLPAWMSGLPGISALVDENGAINAFLVLGALTALLAGAIVTTGLVIGLILRLLDRQTRNVKANPQFQQNLTTLEQREKDRLQALAREQPPTPLPQHERPRWSRVATSLVILFFVFLASFAIADTLYPGGTMELGGGRSVNAGLTLGWILTLFTLLILLWVVPRRSVAVEGGESRPISWNVVWVVVTGLVFLGIGVGLTLAMRVVAVP